MSISASATHIPNFSRDTGRTSLRLAALLLALAGCCLLLAIAFSADRNTLDAKQAAAQSVVHKLSKRVGALKSDNSDLPSDQAFAVLRKRIEQLNSLDFSAALSVSDLLDILEESLPDQVKIVSLRYDRLRGTIDIAAVSTKSNELTHFFEALHQVKLFARTRLAEKMQQVSQGGNAQTQIRIAIEVSRTRAAGAAS